HERWGRGGRAHPAERAATEARARSPPYRSTRVRTGATAGHRWPEQPGGSRRDPGGSHLLMRRCYFDTSAVMKMLRDEPHSDDVTRWVADPEVEAVSSFLLETELRRTAMRWGISQDEV